MRTTETVEKNFSGLNCDTLLEPNVNHLASEYMTEHYEEILGSVRKFVGIDINKSEDLVHDVFLSIIQSELEGEGYSISKSNDGDVITVREFVYGRLKGYSKNKNYAREGCDKHTSKKMVKGNAVSVVDFDIIPASSDGDPESMDSIQRAYSNASSYDMSIESIDSEMSLRQDIKFCLEFNDVVGFNLINLFRNIDVFSTNFDNSILDGLREKMKYHNEFGDALVNVLLCAKDHRSVYDQVLATI